MVTAQSRGLVRPKTIFLDTCYIIYLSLFFKLCMTVGLEPTNPSVLNDETLSKYGIQKKRLEMDRLQDGKKLFNYVVKEALLGSEIKTSQFCRLEFLHLLLEKQAHEHLLNAGIPLRLRSHEWSESYLTSLDQTDYSNACDEWEQLKKKLSHYDVELRVLEEEDSDYWGQVIEAASLVMGSILMDVPDAIVYAAAVIAEADELVTTDGDFKTTVNCLENPNAEPWVSIAAQLTQKLIEQNPALAKAAEKQELKLPKAIRLKKR